MTVASAAVPLEVGGWLHRLAVQLVGALPASTPQGTLQYARTRLPAGSHLGSRRTSPVGTEPVSPLLPSAR